MMNSQSSNTFLLYTSLKYKYNVVDNTIQSTREYSYLNFWLRENSLV